MDRGEAVRRDLVGPDEGHTSRALCSLNGTQHPISPCVTQHPRCITWGFCCPQDSKNRRRGERARIGYTGCMEERKRSGLLVPRLRALRQERGWGRYDLALAAGVYQGTIAQAELGYPVAWSTLIRLAQALKITHEELVRETEAP